MFLTTFFKVYHILAEQYPEISSRAVVGCMIFLVTGWTFLFYQFDMFVLAPEVRDVL